ncbi:acyl-CoA carboxylase subunit beta [candidate division WOR-3 bacterium]|nr:acyl-CoA carboxylase subunit beta [candidate division WOR-3 bacterium]
MSIREKMKKWFSQRASLIKGGGEKAIEKQKIRGKLFARDRIASLLDNGSFVETDLFVEHTAKDFGLEKQKLAADGVITGYGKINGRNICVFAQDFTVAGGSLGKMHALKITKIMDISAKMGVPIIGLNDSGGARIQEGVDALAGYGDIFFRNTRYSGVVPQISVILGPCAGGAVYSPALMDFVFVVNKVSKMFITGPQVIKSVIGEDISMEELGGAKTHFTKTGNVHFYSEDEDACFNKIRELLSYIPDNFEKPIALNESSKPSKKFNIENIIPSDPKEPYDMRHVINSIADDSQFLEVQAGWARNIIVGFIRLNGRSTGVVANQPDMLAGVLDVNASDKSARFVRFCDSFNIPLLTLVDMPGYLPGIDQEHAGVIRHGAKLLYAYSEATVPKITLILRKAYGGGYIAMCSKHLGADIVFAWPSAEIAVMGPQGAANIIFRKEIENSLNPEITRQKKIDEYIEKFANPYVAASKGYVDAVINPDETRDMLIKAFDISSEKNEHLPRKKHSNMPV